MRTVYKIHPGNCCKLYFKKASLLCKSYFERYFFLKSISSSDKSFLLTVQKLITNMLRILLESKLFIRWIIQHLTTTYDQKFSTKKKNKCFILEVGELSLIRLYNTAQTMVTTHFVNSCRQYLEAVDIH